MTINRMFFYYFLAIAMFICIITIGSVVFLFEKKSYDILINNKIFSIPLGLFIVGSSIILAIIFSLLLSKVITNKFKNIENNLFELANGNIKELPEVSEQVKQFVILQNYITQVQNRLKQQVLLSQKIANERASWSEQAVQEVVSKERNRLARELHDSVSQQLFAASMLLSALNEQSDAGGEQLKKQLDLIEGIVIEAQSEMRALLLHLRPVQLEGKSLQQGIKELLQEISAKHEMKIVVELDDVRLEKGVEDHLFRIVQEALSNTLRHAKASTFEVKLKQIKQFVLLKLVDDGIGFQMGQQKVGSYGLKNINERISEIAGTTKIISIPNKGTSIEVKVPVIN